MADRDPVARSLSGPRFTVTELGNGRYQISSGDRHQLAWATGPPAARWIFFDGRVYLVNTRAAGTGMDSQALHDDLALASPMPATVSAVHVTPGQTVARGDVLLMLEAMKMEVPITAPRDGRVRSVACMPGELVQPGVPLIELEPGTPIEPEPGTEPRT